MKTRKLGGFGTFALALAIGSLASCPWVRGAETGDHKEHHESMRACAESCSTCQRECDSCATHCAAKLSEGKKEHLATLETCQDCATLCAAAAQIVSRGGPFAGLVCDACAKACDRCAAACEKFTDDAHMKQCAEQCRKCQKACVDMTKHLASN